MLCLLLWSGVASVLASDLKSAAVAADGFDLMPANAQIFLGKCVNARGENTRNVVQFIVYLKTYLKQFYREFRMLKLLRPQASQRILL